MHKLSLWFLFFTTSLYAIPPEDTCIVATKLDGLITLDPAEAFEQRGLEFVYNTYDRLLYSDGQRFVPELASEWEISEDGKRYTFTIREGVLFRSGRELTAEDCAYSLQRVVEKNASPAALYNQFGWRADDVEERVYAQGKSTLVVETEVAYAPSLLLYVLTTTSSSVVDAQEVKSHPEGWLKNHYAGSGPFALEQYEPQERLVLKSNESHFLGPQLKKVEIRHIPEQSTRELLLKRGDIDIACEDFGLGESEKIEVVRSVQPMTYYMGMNMKNRYLQIPQVRRAIKHLLDYEQLADILEEGKLEVHQSFIPKGFLGCLEERPFAFDVDKARALLKEVGLESGFTVTLDAANVEMAQAIAAMLKKGNIDVKILVGDQKQVLTKVRARKHELAISVWICDFSDPHSNASTFVSNADNSEATDQKTLAWRNSWEIPELTKWTKSAMIERSLEKRVELYEKLQRAFFEEAPFAVMFQSNGMYATRVESKSKGVKMKPNLSILEYYTRK